MGWGVENVQNVAHTQSSLGSNDYQMHVHRGDAGIDSWSTGYAQSDYDTFKAQAWQGQSAFDSAVGSVLGSWYTNLSGAFKAGLRELFQRL